MNIDETVMKKKLACCNFDGASIMMGNKSGVAKRLQEILQRPVCIIHCAAHNPEEVGQQRAKHHGSKFICIQLSSTVEGFGSQI